MHVRQIPHRVGLHRVTPVAGVLEQLLVGALILADREAPVGVVLQPHLRAGVALEAEPEGMVHPERQPVAKAAVERRLDRVIRRMEPGPLHVDRTEPGVGAQQVN